MVPFTVVTSAVHAVVPTVHALQHCSTCRSGYFSYQYDSDQYGVQLYNFGLPKEELKNTSQDAGFYPNGPSGVLNITCVAPGNVPMFISKPHFLDADPDYLKNTSGLHPERALHDSYVGVEPITGSTPSHIRPLIPLPP